MSITEVFYQPLGNYIERICFKRHFWFYRRQIPSGPSFGKASNICWTIEAPSYSPRIPPKPAMPKPWVPQSNKSSSTLASTTSTLVPTPSAASIEKKGKPGRASWFTALVAKFNG
ncbi:hypothetical protein ARMSODRAFT_398496 [Armillaria solidipes]|uniref:Uncharacterized protein n=1 Tax=Armillaria solidipes TaxID=1076256 RepID=A0A2H3CB97_9AGAR|nr:hypothetical protein ARMSODRAFT_398496 [Armillaria solidipes]